MALAEKKHHGSVIFDDTHQLCCTIENAQNVNRHTEYIIKVQRHPSKESWNVSRRFREFMSLNADLQMANSTLPIPRKKLIGNMQPSFVAERQIALQNYLNEILKQPILFHSLAVKQFLDPKNYNSSFFENAMQHVSIALRGDGEYDLKQPLPGIGWRIRKHYFLVTNVQTSKEEKLLIWQSFGPDRHLSDKSLQAAYKSLQSMSHPSIDKAVFMHSLETGAYTIRKIYPNGSMRDFIYGSQYNNTYLAKYGNPKDRKPLTTSQLIHFGLQILQALKFLHEKGLMYGHLHLGNVAVENQRAILLDIENSILGVPFFYRPYILELKKINSMEAVDVYCFGHTLYEMAYAMPLEQATCDNFPQRLPTKLICLLKSILSPEACKRGLPTIDELLSNDFFTSISVSNGFLLSEEDKYHLKFPMQIKDEMTAGTLCILSRLKDDQKLVRSEKRHVKIQEILNSDEAMRKQIKKAKKRDSLARSHSSLNGTSNPVSPTCTNGSSLEARSNSIASSLSNESSLSPRQRPESPHNSTSTSNTPSSPQDNGRSALLNAICSFKKSNLKNISST